MPSIFNKSSNLFFFDKSKKFLDVFKFLKLILHFQDLYDECQAHI